METTKISDVIQHLETIKKQHGDICVVVDGQQGGYHQVLLSKAPEVSVRDYFYRDEADYYGPWWRDEGVNLFDPAPGSEMVKCVYLGKIFSD